jgi:hypothetical protein
MFQLADWPFLLFLKNVSRFSRASGQLMAKIPHFQHLKNICRCTAREGRVRTQMLNKRLNHVPCSCSSEPTCFTKEEIPIWNDDLKTSLTSQKAARRRPLLMYLFYIATNSKPCVNIIMYERKESDPNKTTLHLPGRNVPAGPQTLHPVWANNALVSSQSVRSQAKHYSTNEERRLEVIS